MITPEKLAEPGTEDAHQMALFAYCAVAQQYGFNVADDWATGMGIDAALSGRANRVPLPELRWLHHIPNGDQTAQRGAKMRGMGLKRGVWDIFLPVSRDSFSGLYIELKKPGREKEKLGGLSEDQLKFQHFVTTQGFSCCICYGWEQARNVLQWYLG